MTTAHNLCTSAIEKVFHHHPKQRHTIAELVKKAIHFLHQAEHAIEHAEYYVRNAIIQGVHNGWIHWTNEGALHIADHHAENNNEQR